MLDKSVALQEDLFYNTPKLDESKISILDTFTYFLTAFIGVLVFRGKTNEALLIAENKRSRALADRVLSLHHPQGNEVRNMAAISDFSALLEIVKTLDATVLYYALLGSELCLWVIKPNGGVTFRKHCVKGKDFLTGKSGSSRVVLYELINNTRELMRSSCTLECEDRSLSFLYPEGVSQQRASQIRQMTGLEKVFADLSVSLTELSHDNYTCTLNDQSVETTVNTQRSRKKDPPKVKNEPATVRNSLTETQDEPAKIQDNPKETQDKPVKIQDYHAETQDRPAKVEDNLTEAQDEAEKIQVSYTETQDEPRKIQDNPTETQNKPAKIQGVETTVGQGVETTVATQKSRKNDPAKVKNEPQKVRNILAETQDEPANLTEPQEGPTKIQDDRTETQEEPAKIEDNLAETLEEPAKIQDNLTETQEEPAKIEDNLTETQDEPGKIQVSYTETQDKPGKIQDNLTETQDKPGKMQDNVTKTQDELAKIQDNLTETHDEPRNIQDNLREIQDEPRKIQDNLRETQDKPAKIQGEHREPNLLNMLKEMYDIVLRPVREFVEGSQVVIVPDGSIPLLPFACLVDESGNYVADNLQVRLVPSLAIAKMISEYPREPQSQSCPLIVGDPEVCEFEDGDYVYEKATRLPHANEEAHMIANLLKVEPLTGRKATKEDVLQRLDNANLIHVAAHGDSDRGEILLAPSPEIKKKTISKEDVMLTVTDLEQKRLKAQLVVLSCCYSGQGDVRAEGVVGIARAFLGAGAHAVLVTLWAISDKATLFFMEKFYSQLVDGKSASVALAKAMGAMRRSKKFRSPSYWAPFVLVGEDVTPFNVQ